MKNLNAVVLLASFSVFVAGCDMMSLPGQGASKASSFATSAAETINRQRQPASVVPVVSPTPTPPSPVPAEFTLWGATVGAGGLATFTINRVSGSGAVSFYFTTTDGTAKAGVDYDSWQTAVTLAVGANSQQVNVPTHVNASKPGQTLSFNGSIYLNGILVGQGTSNIVEPGVAPAPSVSPTPTPTPSQTTQSPPVVLPAPTPSVASSPGFVMAPVTPIADNFNTADGIQVNSWITGPSPDDTGNFRMICGAGQIAYDDPIVYPGQPGASHLHQFFGNLGTNANSTYQSLRSSGNSTCGDPNNPAAVNRSGYWMPAMLDGAGHVVKPEYVAIYYKRQPLSDPRCTRSNPGSIGDCVGIPTGLRFITGYNMNTGTSDAHPFFYCQGSDLGGPTTPVPNPSLHDKMNDAIPDCAVGTRLTLNMAGPDCWDGQHADSPDHRSHMAHGAYTWDPVNGSYYRCDDAHPYHIPQMSLIVFYVVDANFMAGKWHLSSDEMVPGTAPGSTFHTDYFEAWSPTVRATWDQYCTNGHEQCAGGDLGNGTGIKGMTVPNDSGLVPVPPQP